MTVGHRMATVATSLSVVLSVILSIGGSGGCSSGDPGDPGMIDPGPDPDPDPTPSYADADWLFEPEHLLDVDIDIAEEDWDALRFQSRTILDIFGESCGSEPAGSPFTYVPATVTVDGQVMDNVGIRKKGFLGSLDEDRPSLKIKFNKYVAGQRLTGLERMTLNNNKQDASHMNQCLGYQLFADAGVPAPRCNFARVSINGRPMGIYTHVESVKKAFLGRHFADNDGNLYEGTLSDFRPGWHATFERKTNKANPPGTEDRSDIQAIVDALELDDEAMYAALDGLIDLDGFYSFWAVEAMLSHWDGYGGNNNNFFMYGDPDTGKFTFMPWGIDQLFGDPTGGPVLTRSLITRRLYEYDVSRQQYLARYQELLEQVWSDGDKLAQIDRVEDVILPYLTAEQVDSMNLGLDWLRSSIDGRGERMADALASAGPNDAQPVSEPLCFVQSGQASATFSVTWNGGAVQDATLDVTVNGENLPTPIVTAISGPDEERPGRTVLYMFSETSNNRTVVIVIGMPDELVAPGTVEVGGEDTDSLILMYQTGAPEPYEAYFMSGPLTLDEASPTQGAAIQGSFDLSAWDPPWF